jgi:hypothetical protein
MITSSYREFFAAAAGSTGALIGLLFVAVSVTSERAREPEARVAFRSRASAALLLFTNALVLSLAALIPGASIGWWAIVLAVLVLTFAAATARLAFRFGHFGSDLARSLSLVLALVAVAGFEIYAGVKAISHPGNSSGQETMAYVVIAELAVGIARAWELVGLRDTGLIASLGTLARGQEGAGAIDSTSKM